MSMPTATVSRICKTCRNAPVFEPYDYCGRKCASFAKNRPRRSQANAQGPGQYSNNSSASSTAVAQSTLCLNCLVYPRIPGHDFCSKACREEGKYKLRTGRYYVGSIYFGASQKPPPPPGNPCVIRGCTKAEHSPGSKYCSNGCRKAAVTQGLEVACLLCKIYPKMPRKHFCSKTCSKQAENQGPCLLELPPNDPKHTDIVNQFNAKWRSGTKPNIQKIYKVVNSNTTEDNFQKYRQTVEAKGKYVVQGKSAGNELRRWHGTGRRCNIGDSSSNLKPCGATNCALCCIISTSFSVTYAAQGSYGKGIYTSSFASTSSGYTYKATSTSPYKAMFLTRLIAGNIHVVGAATPTPHALMAPPTGFDSVASDAAHNELIVYRNDAVCPSWLILYQ